jgi:hypothetical protein
MSYCVNCGVELARTEKQCPLCGVPVINPAEGVTDEEKSGFPHRREPLESAFDRELWIKLVSIVLAVPAVICFVSNMMVFTQVFWSLYVVGGLVVCWTFCVSPFLFKRYFPLLWIVANTGATLGYLFLIEFLSAGKVWFLQLALPMVLGVALLSFINVVLIRKRILMELNLAAGIFLSIGLLTVLIDLSLSHYLTGSLLMGWSLFSLISCIAISAALVLIQRQLNVKEKLKRRLHF